MAMAPHGTQERLEVIAKPAAPPAVVISRVDGHPRVIGALPVALAGDVLHELLQGRKGGLRAREISRLQGLAQLLEELRKPIHLAPARAAVLAMRSGRLALEILLEGGKVLLRPRQVPGL